MNKDELSQAIAIADTSNNEGTRLAMKIDAILAFLLSPGEPSAVWICEQHPEREWPHDDCAGPGMLSDDRRIELLEADVRELRGYLNLRPGDFRFEPVFRGPGANETVLQMYGIPVQLDDEAQVLADAAAVEAVLIGGAHSQSLPPIGPTPHIHSVTPGYANHASEAPSTSLYDVMPERSKLERMTVADLKALAERHGITLADGNKGTIIDAMAGPKASS